MNAHPNQQTARLLRAKRGVEGYGQYGASLGSEGYT